MDLTGSATRARGSGPFRAASVALFALLMVSGPAFAACSDAHATASDGGWATAMPTMDGSVPTSDASAVPSGDASAVPASDADMPMAEAEAIWAARPDFVRASAQTEEAYAFALQHPQIVRWMPCYCGCAAMGHGSNLDCYYKHGQPGDRAVFEEHASYCDICVQITLKTKHLAAEGKSLHEIRQIIDQTFSGSAPGTPTVQPPA